MNVATDCVIVGAGIVGAAAARCLALAGRRVVLLDRGTPGGEATSAAAGMLAPQTESAAGMLAPQTESAPQDPSLRLAVQAREQFPKLAADLMQATGLDVAYRRCGIAVVAREAAEADLLRALALEHRAADLAAEWLDAASLAKRHPGIGPSALGAFLAPEDGVVNNVVLVAALLAGAARSGVEIRDNEEVTLVIVERGRVSGVRTKAGTYRAPFVVIAAGAWSAGLAGLPRPIPVEPVRGQMAIVTWPEGEPAGVIFRRGAYVVPRGREALLGSTMDRAGFVQATTVGGLARIFEETGALLPALLEQPVRKTWSGMRPITPDGHAILGPDPEVEGLIYATGHGRHGILWGPMTGEIVRDLVVDGASRVDLRPYSIQRFDKAIHV